MSGTPEAWPRDAQEARGAPIEVLRAMALTPSLGRLRIFALETLAEKPDLEEDAFRATFLAPVVWRSTDEHVRWLAVKAVAARGPVRYVEPVLEALGDSTWLVREHATAAALGALRALGDEAARHLAEGNPRWRTLDLPSALVFLRAPVAEVRAGVEELLGRLAAASPAECVDAFGERALGSVSEEPRHLYAGLLRGLLARVEPELRAGRFDRIARELEWARQTCLEAADRGEAAVNAALAAAIASWIEVFTESDAPMPDFLLSFLWRAVADPNPRVAAHVEAVLDTRAVFRAFARAALGIGSSSFAPDPLPSKPPEHALARLLRAFGRIPWSEPDSAHDVRFASRLAFHHAGHDDFRVRRAARGLLAALGDHITGELLDACRLELARAGGDASLAARLRCAASPWVLERLCEEASSLGSEETLAALDALLASAREDNAVLAVSRARRGVLRRLFALRSFLVILWNAPERETLAGEPSRAVLAEASHHPTHSIREAANLGR